MGITTSLLGEVLTESMSKEHVTVLKKLSKPKHDEEIAAQLKLKATVVRTLLNDLHAENLVEYERSKNKKTGWYTYLWKKRDDKINEYVNSYLDRRLDDLNRQLEQEREGVTFNCGCERSDRVSMGDAMETDFMCPECNQVYVESDNGKIIKNLESEIKKIGKLRAK
ncbi:MAG: DUF742 domain-containing protein [Candidatus Altiarchaeota archaeon]|nr:DUF742 domain-containing protein [Candidatus Altiarchaeota archaeon]